MSFDMSLPGLALIEQAIPEGVGSVTSTADTHLIVTGRPRGAAGVGRYAAVLSATVDTAPNVMGSLLVLDA